MKKPHDFCRIKPMSSKPETVEIPVSDLENLPANWAIRNWQVRRKPIRFFDTKEIHRYRPFLVGYLNDLHPHKVAIKARQIGLTETSLIELCWLISTLDIPLKIVYAFPRGRQASEFSKTRFDPAIEGCPILAKRVKEVSAGLKQFRIPGGGVSFVEIKSTWEEEFGEATDADIIYFDEYDRMQRNIVPAFEESLKSSVLGWKRYISTPTLPDIGVSGEYNNSDRRRWFLKCSHCSEWQNLTYEENVRQMSGSDDLMRFILAGEVTTLEPGTFEIVCRKCKKPLTRLEDGCWVAEYPSVTEVRGYHFSQLMAPWISANQIILSVQRYKLKSIWYNYVLGEPYKETGTTLSIRSSGELPQPTRGNYQTIAVGIDWGKVNWAVVVGKNPSKPAQVLTMFYTQDTKEPLGGVKELAERISVYNPDIIIADAGWGADRIEYLRQRFGKKAWGCFYAKRTLKTFNPEWNTNTGIVQISKIALIKFLKHLLDEGEVLNLNETTEQGRLIKKHIENTMILETEEEKGLVEEVVKSGDDHLLHCLAYAVLGLTQRTVIQQAKATLITLYTT